MCYFEKGYTMTHMNAITQPLPAVPNRKRVARLIEWLKSNEAAIEAPEKFTLTLHFGGTNITAEKTEKLTVPAS